jgi:hypothetical protein
VARSRCLLILSVLSGEKPVTQAIAEAQISRPGYYQMETRALKAMLSALSPLSSTSADGAASQTATRRIAQLEQQVQKLTQDKRRAERMLLMTRKSIHFAVALGHRHPPPKDRDSIRSGKNRSPLSRMKATPSAASTPTPAGADAS